MLLRVGLNRNVDGPADVRAKVVYTVANPVEAGLVSHGGQWPGLRLYRPGPMRIERPEVFFDLDGDTPEVAELELVAPPIDAESSREAVRIIEEAV